MNEKLLNLIEENARLSSKEMSVMLGISEQEVESEIKALEDKSEKINNKNVKLQIFEKTFLLKFLNKKILISLKKQLIFLKLK